LAGVRPEHLRGHGRARLACRRARHGLVFPRLQLAAATQPARGPVRLFLQRGGIHLRRAIPFEGQPLARAPARSVPPPGPVLYPPKAGPVFLPSHSAASPRPSSSANTPSATAVASAPRFQPRERMK